MKQKQVSKKIIRKHKNGDTKVYTIKQDILVPSGEGVAVSLPSRREEKGSACDRAFKRRIDDIKNDISHHGFIRSNKRQHVIHAASQNARLVMESYDKIEELEKYCHKLEEENKEAGNEQFFSLTISPCSK